MKWYNFFIIFFCIFFIIGAINGHHSDIKKNTLFERSIKNLRFYLSEPDRKVILFLLDNSDSILYSYDVGEKQFRDINEVHDYSKNDLFPLNADDIIKTLAYSAIGIPTVSDMMKILKSYKFSKPNKLQIQKKYSKKIISVIIGGVSGYTLGYYLFKPKLNIELLKKEFSELETWGDLNKTLMNNRISELKLCYNYLSYQREKDNQDSLSYESKFIIRVINELGDLKDDFLKFNTDFFYIYQYTELRHKWLQYYYKPPNAKEDSFPEDIYEANSKEIFKAFRKVFKRYDSMDTYVWKDVYNSLDTIVNYESMQYLHIFHNGNNNKIQMAITQFLLKYRNILLLRLIKSDLKKKGFCIENPILCEHYKQIIDKYESNSKFYN